MTFVWPDPAPISDTEVDDLDWMLAESRIEAAFRRLAQLRELGRDPVVLSLVPEARARFSQWRLEHLQGARELHPDEMPAHLAKAPGRVARLALNHCLLEWAIAGGPVPTVISDTHVAAAIDYSAYLDAHYSRVLCDVEEPEPERLARELARWIIRERPKRINTMALRREVRLPGLRSEDRLRIALEELRIARWVTGNIPRSPYEPLPRWIDLTDVLREYLHPNDPDETEEDILDAIH